MPILGFRYRLSNMYLQNTPRPSTLSEFPVTLANHYKQPRLLMNTVTFPLQNIRRIQQTSSYWRGWTFHILVHIAVGLITASVFFQFTQSPAKTPIASVLPHRLRRRLVSGPFSPLRLRPQQDRWTAPGELPTHLRWNSINSV